MEMRTAAGSLLIGDEAARCEPIRYTKIGRDARETEWWRKRLVWLPGRAVEVSMSVDGAKTAWDFEIKSDMLLMLVLILITILVVKVLLIRVEVIAFSSIGIVVGKLDADGWFEDWIEIAGGLGLRKSGSLLCLEEFSLALNCVLDHVLYI